MAAAIEGICGACKKGWLARHSHHQRDERASSFGCVSMGEELCAVGGLVVVVAAVVEVDSKSG